MKIGNCQACEARIIMARHQRTRKLAPIEVDPSEDGNIVVVGDEYYIVTKEMREMAIKRNLPLRVNHFARCAYARTFAKPAAAKATNVIPFRRRARA